MGPIAESFRDGEECSGEARAKQANSLKLARRQLYNARSSVSDVAIFCLHSKQIGYRDEQMTKPRKQGQQAAEQTVVLRAFSVDHAARVTGLSKARLTRWDREGFFSPEQADESDRGNPHSRIYSFGDLVGLRTLAILTDKHRISIPELRKTYPELAKKVKRPWADTRLSVLNGKVVWNLDTVPQDRHGQIAGRHIELPTIASEVARKAEELRHRNSDQIGATERHKFIAHNARVMAGTRIPVTAIESFIRAGHSDDAIVSEYPTLATFDVSTVRRHMSEAA